MRDGEIGGDRGECGQEQTETTDCNVLKLPKLFVWEFTCTKTGDMTLENHKREREPNLLEEQW